MSQELITAEVSAGTLELVSQATRAGVYSDLELVDLWVSDQRSEQTKKLYRRTGYRLVSFLQMRLKKLDEPLILRWAEPSDFKAFEAALIDDDKIKSMGTVATMTATARSLFRFAERTKHIEHSPAHAFKLLQTDAAPSNKVLSEDEIVAILNGAGSEDNRTLLEFLYKSGARAREAVDLTWSRVNVIDGFAHVTIIGKGKKIRVIQLPKKITAKLLKLRTEDTHPNDPVFTRRKAKNGLPMPIAVETIRDILHEACYRVGITRPVSPHWLRHSHGTHADRQGAALTAIQDALGHSDPRTTRRYVQANHGVMLAAGFIGERD